MRLVYVFLMIIFLIFGCKYRENADLSKNTSNFKENIEKNDEKVEKTDLLRIFAAEIVSSMNDKILASQVIISGIDGNNTIPPHIVRLLKTAPTGGIILFAYNVNTDRNTIRGFLSEISALIKDESGIPPFIAFDHEGGTVYRFKNGIAALPDASSYWDLYQKEGWDSSLSKIEKDSLKAGKEIFDLGFNMNFAPVAEYYNEENNVFLIGRSYGPDPFFTAHGAAAFVRGMEQAGVICVVKHFPGSAGADPHFFPSVLNMNKNELNSLVTPFTALINRGARAVMVAHTFVPQIDSVIASLSPVVMQNWLRDELGFDGIIISDDFKMASAGNLSPEQAAVNSIIAGTDMIIVWPPDLIKTHNAIIAALEEGRLPRERLADAAQRVIYEKLRMKLME